MNQKIRALGYCICRKIKTPDCMKHLSEEMIPVSGCFEEHEPQIRKSHNIGPDGDDQSYWEGLGLSYEQYLSMSREIQELFEDKLYHFEGIFAKSEDAVSFYNKYYKSSDYVVISISLDERYEKYFDEDISWGQPETQFQKELIGHDIIGFDCGVMHSYLCNGLEAELEEARFNQYCLLSNDYSEVENMADRIQGMGEPVDWIPVQIHRIIPAL